MSRTDPLQTLIRQLGEAYSSLLNSLVRQGCAYCGEAVTTMEFADQVDLEVVERQPNSDRWVRVTQRVRAVCDDHKRSEGDPEAQGG